MFTFILAFVEFEDEEGMKKALSLNSKLLINNIKILVDKSPGQEKVTIYFNSSCVITISCIFLIYRCINRKEKKIAIGTPRGRV